MITREEFDKAVEIVWTELTRPSDEPVITSDEIFKMIGPVFLERSLKNSGISFSDNLTTVLREVATSMLCAVVIHEVRNRE